jgi:DNA-binding response OmpR family regulator
MKKKLARILLVEDEPSLINLYQAVLKNDYTIDVCVNYESAKDYLNQQKPDLILLDIIIPVKDNTHLDYSQRVGFDLLKYIKKQAKYKKLPVITLTNLDSPQDRKISKDLKAVDYVVKSNVLPIELLKKIRNILVEGKK